MSAQIETTTTKRFIDYTWIISLISLSLVILAGFFSLFFYREIIDERVTVEPEQTVELESVTLEPRLIGALRIDVEALLDTSRWVTYEIQLYDKQDQLLASAINESWYSAGTWHQGGESGSWEQEDVLGGLDVKLGEQDKKDVTIAITVFGVGPEQGRTNNVNAPVPFEVEVQDGVIDTRYLWLGFFGTLTMTILSYISVQNTGQVKIREAINDSDVGERAILGGADSLVKVIVKILADETSPARLSVNLSIKDGLGNQIYSERHPIMLRFHKDDDGDIEKATAKFQELFILTRRGSYGFYVEVTPDEPVDRTTLIVKENVKTVTTVDGIKTITVDEA